MKKKTNTVLLISFLLWLTTLSAAAQTTYDSYIEQALAAAQAKHYDEAIDLFRQALKTAPGDIRNALTYANIAHLQELKGENLKAIENYDMALGIAPLNVPILKAQADLLMTLGMKIVVLYVD